MCLCCVAFVREILYCCLWASSECMMQFLDTHKSDRNACWGSCNDEIKVSKNETHIIVICKQTYVMHFVHYHAHKDASMCLWLCFTLVMLVLIPHIRCILFWIYNSCKLVEISFNAMVIQKVHWIWANSLIIHEIVCIQRISLTSIFMTIIYLPFT